MKPKGCVLYYTSHIACSRAIVQKASSANQRFTRRVAVAMDNTECARFCVIRSGSWSPCRVGSCAASGMSCRTIRDLSQLLHRAKIPCTSSMISHTTFVLTDSIFNSVPEWVLRRSHDVWRPGRTHVRKKYLRATCTYVKWRDMIDEKGTGSWME